MIGPHHASHGHKLRFYIVMITLVVGATFLFLFINNNTEGISLTSAFVSDITDETVEGEAEDLSLTESFFEKVEEVEEESNKKVNLGTNLVNFKLSFDQIPEINKEAKLEEIELGFTDLTTKINVNTDKLELNNLQEVNLKVKDFVGKVEFNALGISIDGTANRIEVNNIALSSNGEIKLSFSDLDYNFLNIKNLELKEIELPNGEGSLEVGEKMNYDLDNEEVNIFSYEGEVTINRESGTSLDLVGSAKGLGVNGDNLQLSLS
jgi:hypothetical protein